MAGSPFASIKRKLGMRGPTKPGELITRMNKMKMSEWEKSSMDAKLDKKLGYKEGSKEDNKADRKALKAYNSKGRKSTIKKII